MAKELIETLGVESYHHLVSDDDGGCGTAAILVDQVLHRILVTADIAIFIRDSSLREVGPDCVARWSAGLGEKDNLCVGHRGMCQHNNYSAYSIARLIFAVFCSMAETEQYFSSDSRTASSTALWDTLPPTR